ncbi:response regulator [Tautonia plasticadhaerens]|uniref:Nitrogen assimilation regulatory protein n=1 Tax=Tautonia plasticadhaerens TaxID=2527974 RepID=A0A518GVQ0_9BACT|nr:response regulator [Tautonia plasticadhaerens]QDV32687.1 Nitrogen assimilation regulatory protein [Tautonia plasticadhaerens]
MRTLLSDPEGADASSGNSPPFILLVDDDPTGRQAIACLLLDAGMRCVAVGSGDEALDLCGDRIPRLVITDLCMPGLDGRGLGLRLRARFPTLGLILITAESLDDSQLGELRHTFDDVQRKPVDCVRFLDRVCHLAD